MTTIWVHKLTKQLLDDVSRKNETCDQTLKRLLLGEADVYVNFLMVDGELPQSHTIVFQLGDNPPRYYLYDKGKLPIAQISIEQAQAMIRARIVET